MLQEHTAGAEVGALCRRHGISEQTLYRWKRKYGGLEVGEARRLRALEEENARLKATGGRPGARQPDAPGAARKKLLGPTARRTAVHHVEERFAVSERRACGLVGIRGPALRYQGRVRADEAWLRERLRDLAKERPRFHYRRLHVLLGREGFVVNHKRVERLYRDEGLVVRRRKRKRTGWDLHAPVFLATALDETWGLDVVSDALA